MLLHFVAHGVLFEEFFDEGGTYEDAFTREVVLPAMARVREDCGVAPMIVRAWPALMEWDEYDYWRSYPPLVNDYLVRFARERGIRFKREKRK
jgi:hypothetical protein